MKIIAMLFGAASLLAVGTADGFAEEITAQPLGLATGGLEATTVAFGCGPGFVPNVYGICRPRFYGYGHRRFGWGRPYGFGYGSGYRGYGYRRRFGFY